MGIDKFIKDTIAARNLRASDPVLKAKLDAERQKMRESWTHAGNKTLEDISSTILNAGEGLFLPKKVGRGRKSKSVYDPAGQVPRIAADATGATLALIGRILAASGRSAWYGI